MRLLVRLLLGARGRQRLRDLRTLLEVGADVGHVTAVEIDSNQCAEWGALLRRLVG